VVEQSQKTFSTGKTKDIAWRKSQLKALYKLLEENEKEICDAVHKDLRKPNRETYMFEFVNVKNDICLFLSNLESFMKPERVPGQGIATLLDRCEIRREPLGVVLIIGPWN
jgi:acyl-CoA reductase-like NAD-dependent aldehyde dehydrogenase